MRDESGTHLRSVLMAVKLACRRQLGLLIRYHFDRGINSHRCSKILCGGIGVRAETLLFCGRGHKYGTVADGRGERHATNRHVIGHTVENAREKERQSKL